MKKIISFVLASAMALGAGVTCFAQRVERADFGFSYTLSDNWTKSSDDSMVQHIHFSNSNEGITVTAIKTEGAFSLGSLDENYIKNICDNALSNEVLSTSLTEKNNIYVTVSTDSVVTKKETYNGISFFRYEKAYTARATGYYDTPFYASLFVTAKNGYIYVFEYTRDTAPNHFEDFVALLNSLSFDLGTIKINIDGERIYPDSDPVIIDGTTFVPIKAIAEKMDFAVEWDGENQLVKVVSADNTKTVFFKIGYASTVVNGEELSLSSAPFVLNDRTYLPVRVIAETMGADVDWNGETKTVLIFSDNLLN